MKTHEIVTKQDLLDFKKDLLEELKSLMQNTKPVCNLLKSKEVKRILGCVDSTLQYYRQSGQLPFSKIGGTYYYGESDVYGCLAKSANRQS